MDEIWTEILDFPTYSISNYGLVMNRETGRHIRLSYTKSDVVKVGLVRGGVQYTRSVKNLVAEAFLPGKTEVFNTPMQLDGNPRNTRVDNLVWRPRWFAWMYHRQFSEITPYHKRGPIVDIVNKQKYRNLMEAAIVNGILIREIWMSIMMKHVVFPTNQIFELVK